MIGSDLASVPAQGQAPKDAGDKKVSDFISEDTVIRESGEVTGTLHYVTGVKAFGEGEKGNGYFIPVTLAQRYDGQEITVTGVNGSQTHQDLEWLVQVRGTDTTVTFATNQSDVFLTLTFGRAGFEKCPVGKAAFDAGKADYGRFGRNELYYEGGHVDIAWDGPNAEVTGKLLHVKTADAESLSADGNYFAFALISWFKGKQVAVEGSKKKTEEETDWVCLVKDKSKPITVTHEGETVARFDLSSVEFAPAPVRTRARTGIKAKKRA